VSRGAANAGRAGRGGYNPPWEPGFRGAPSWSARCARARPSRRGSWGRRRPGGPTDRASLPSLERSTRPRPPLHLRVLPLVQRPPEYLHWNYLDGSSERPEQRLHAAARRLRRALARRDRAARRWIRETGVGAVALSWWGHDNFMDAAVPLIMDVMKDYDLKVTFALEPTRQIGAGDSRTTCSTCSIASGRSAPSTPSSCRATPRTARPGLQGLRLHPAGEHQRLRGQVHRNPNYTPDASGGSRPTGWRLTLRGEFDHLTLLARLPGVRAHTRRRASTASGSTTTSSGPTGTCRWPAERRRPAWCSRSNVNSRLRAGRAPPLPPTVPDRRPRHRSPPTPATCPATPRPWAGLGLVEGRSS
jgi:hypothetical protein